MAEAYIVAAVRTAGGKKNGRLSKVHPADMGGRVIDAVVERIAGEYRALAGAGGAVLGRGILDLITVNGIRVELEGGAWLLVRASSNKPELVVVVESLDSADDMRALFHEEVKPRLAAHPEVGGYNQEV